MRDENEMLLAPLEWQDGSLRLLDQTLLPGDEVWLSLTTHTEVADAIRSMRVRGAPAIGVAAAYGIALAALRSEAASREELLGELRSAAVELEATRPTAVNLSWAVRRMLARADATADVGALRELVVEEAQRIHREDVEANQRLGMLGAELLPDEVTVLTHCNAGALATAGYGTALGVVRAAVEMGKRVRVVATETRPLLQGARLTAWELARSGIQCKLIVDGAAAALMRRGEIDAVVVGADRIAANGDTANKIGTYALALAARAHDVPCYVAAPTSTLDLKIAGGDQIPIEERSVDEVLSFAGRRVTADGAGATNPAFDVTPGGLISAIVTERGVAREPFGAALARLFDAVEAPA